jgi:thiol-disulfide isomerase/thioredoxin
MHSARFGTKASQLKTFLVALALFAPLPPSARAGEAPESIAVLDSLTGGAAIQRGSVVYVDFWASWCVPCRKSFPWMMDLMGEYRDQGLQVVTINVDRDGAAAHKFLDETHASLDVVYDPAGKLAKLYDLQVMPTSFVYGRDGILKLRREGFDPGETESVERLIHTLLEEEVRE